MRDLLSKRASAWPYMVLTLLAGCGAGNRDSDEAGLARHLVLVSIDTLRADRLSCYGYERLTSPAIDALAARGMRFESVRSETSWTLPAHVTLLSGLEPTSHGVVQPALAPHTDVPLLAEVLRHEGFRTFGGTGGGFVGRPYGFDRGFERFDDRQASLAETLFDARSFLTRRADGERAFVFVHTYDVHCPYEPADEYRAGLVSPGAEPFPTEGRCGNPDFNAVALTPGNVEHLSDLYDAGIREADASLGAFLDWLEESGLARRTLVVLTSDHGEELYEHGAIGHERSLHRELLHVPLVIAGPRVAQGVVATPTGLADVMPTVLDLLGVALPAGLDGRSLAAAARGAVLPEAEPRVSTLEWQVELRAIDDGERALILDVTDGSARLFAQEDRLQQHDLAPAEEERVHALKARLEAHLEALVPRRTDEASGFGPDDRALLEQLGYG